MDGGFHSCHLHERLSISAASYRSFPPMAFLLNDFDFCSCGWNRQKRSTEKMTMRVESLASLVFEWIATFLHDVGWCLGWHDFGFGVASRGLAWGGVM